MPAAAVRTPSSRWRAVVNTRTVTSSASAMAVGHAVPASLFCRTGRKVHTAAMPATSAMAGMTTRAARGTKSAIRPSSGASSPITRILREVDSGVKEKPEVSAIITT